MAEPARGDGGLGKFAGWGDLGCLSNVDSIRLADLLDVMCCLRI